MKFEFPTKIFEEYSSIKFRDNLSTGSRIVPCGGRTHRRKDGQRWRS